MADLVRLKRLREVLRARKAQGEKLVMAHWYRDYTRAGLPADDMRKDDHVPHTCKTAACALGYAGLDPNFVSQGLVTDTRTGQVTLVNNDSSKPTDYGLTAGRIFFGLTPGEAEYLFMPSGNFCPAVVKLLPGADRDTFPAVIKRVSHLIRHYETGARF